MNSDLIMSQLAGEIVEYVDNYMISKNGSGRFCLQPTYPVDYEIRDISDIVFAETVEEYYAHKIAECRRVDDLPEHLKRLVKQYLPRFFENHPGYKSAECLLIKDEF